MNKKSSRIWYKATRALNVLYFAWRDRKKNAFRGFSSDEAEFLPGALELQEQPVSRTSRVVASILILLLAFSISWALLGEMEIVVQAQGKVIPQGSVKTIAAPETNIVREILVVEGQLVSAGDPLLVLDSTAPAAEEAKAQAEAWAADLKLGRAKALLEGVGKSTPPTMRDIDGVPADELNRSRLYIVDQYHLLVSKIRRIDDEIKVLEEGLPMIKARAADYKALLATNDVSRHSWMEKEQNRIDIEGQISSLRNQRASTISQARAEYQEALFDAQRLRNSSSQDIKRTNRQVLSQRLLSPVDGYVHQLAIHTIGGVVSAAQPLMSIVPKGRAIELDVQIENKDIAFVSLGQDVAVKIDAIDYTKYGLLKGKVSRISHDAIVDEKRGLFFGAKISLIEKELSTPIGLVPVTPGMSVNIEIKTGSRRPIEYLLSPLIQHKREALNER